MPLFGPCLVVELIHYRLQEVTAILPQKLSFLFGQSVWRQSRRVLIQSHLKRDQFNHNLQKINSIIDGISNQSTYFMMSS